MTNTQIVLIAGFSGVMMGLSGGVFAQTSGPQTYSTVESQVAKSVAIDRQAAAQQKEARATALAANPNAQQGAIDSALNSLVIKNETKNQQQLNQASVASATPSLVEQVGATLPKLAQIGGQLKYGEHIVISQEGPEIIALIRSLVTRKQSDQRAVIARLQEFASNGKPEAVHFLGFSFEHGLYGAPKSLSQATKYYQLAAAQNYQPSLYNLGLIAAYGKSGNAPDLERGLAWMAKAMTIANDTSGRVCGLASFLAFRTNRQPEAVRFAKGCNSALAHIPRASLGDTESLPIRVGWLRDSIATGADDGYSLIAKISKPLIKTDNNFTFCKYVLINRHYRRATLPNIKDEAARCVDQVGKMVGSEKGWSVQREQIIAGVASFVPMEIETLKNMRKSNKFHYSWTVPYLPFAQAETDLFEPLLIKETQR
jgi:hypothetical protein